MQKRGNTYKYKPEMCDKMLQMFSEGMGKMEVCLNLGIAYNTMKNWSRGGKNEIEDFATAVEDGLEMSQAWWEQELRKAAVGINPDANATLMIYNTKNRFPKDWQDRKQVEQTTELNIISDGDLDNEIDALMGE